MVAYEARQKRSVSAVDRMRELHDIEDTQFNNVCNEILLAMQQRVGGH